MIDRSNRQRSIIIIGVVAVVIIAAYIGYQYYSSQLPSGGLTALQQHISQTYQSSQYQTIPSWSVSSAQKATNPQVLNQNANETWCVTISPPIEYYFNPGSPYIPVKYIADNFIVYRIGAAWYADNPRDMNDLLDLGCTNGDSSQFSANLCANSTPSECQP